MDCLNIFLLGTPGCGKSEIFRRLNSKFQEENLAEVIKRVDDFPKLWELFQNDTERERSRETDDGGYKVTDPTVWDDILKELNEDILDLQDECDVLFIEFSRPDYVDSIKNNFSSKILESGLALYIYAPFDVCWERNVKRHEEALAEGDDDHLVSRDEMEETYGEDDHEDLEAELEMPVLIVDNSVDDLSHLDDQIDDVMGTIREEVSSVV